MRNLLTIISAVFFASIIFVGCTKMNDPVSPNDSGNGKDPVINTPGYMKVESITVTNFPATKPNGDKWDWNVFPNSPTRRPDIYVRMGKSGSGSYVYQSDVKEDAVLETAYDSYLFTRPRSSNAGSLPYNVPMNQTYIIDLMDDDGLSADDWMGTVSFTPDNYYNNDNATNFHVTLSSSSLTIKIDGTWIY